MIVPSLSFISILECLIEIEVGFYTENLCYLFMYPGPFQLLSFFLVVCYAICTRGFLNFVSSSNY